MRSIETYNSFHFIYKTENLINGKFYIGVHSTNDQNDRYLGSGLRLNKALKKYGRNNFKRTILEFFNTREEALKREKEIVTFEFCKDDSNYNVDLGGRSHKKTFVTPEEIKNKISKTLKGKKLRRDVVEKVRLNTLGRRGINNGEINKRIKIENLPEYLNNGWVLGTLYKMSDELRAKISKSNNGVKRSQEFKENLSKQNRNNIHINNGLNNKMIKPEKLDEYISNGWVFGVLYKNEDGSVTEVSPCKGIKFSEERKMKMSQSMKGIPKSEEFRKSIGEKGKDKIHINNGEVNTTVHKSEVDEYLANGWKLGMKKRKS